MPYIPYLPYIPNILYFPNMPYQTDHTHHTYPTYHTTPPPHRRRGRGTVTVPHPREGGGCGRAWCIYDCLCISWFLMIFHHWSSIFGAKKKIFRRAYFSRRLVRSRPWSFAPARSWTHGERCLLGRTYQWPFQEPIYWRYLTYIRPIFQGYVRGYTPKILPYMVQYLHFRILEFPLNLAEKWWFDFFSGESVGFNGNWWDVSSLLEAKVSMSIYRL